MPVTSCTRSIETNRRSAASTWKMRSGVGIAAASTSSSSAKESSSRSVGSQLRPSRPVSSERTAFCSDSQNVRPMAITSPTDCICVPSTGFDPGSFSNAQRGNFVTT